MSSAPSYSPNLSHTPTYIGRFAPSPTGPLHFGSLLAALASYLDAKAHHGIWHVRIEDLDPPREDPQAADSILRILDAAQLHWDGEVRYQSQRNTAYQLALDTLIQQGHAFACQCSRKQLDGKPHLGNCHCNAQTDIAWRFLCPAGDHVFIDRLQGEWRESYSQDIGDFVLKRRDGPWSYQLAVVCDDIDQGMTHIVRGIDLIDSTARQSLLYQAFNSVIPTYAHIPVALEANGQKLSKQNLAKPLTVENLPAALFTALRWLQQNPPAELNGSITELLQWAVSNWNLAALNDLQQLPAPASFQR